MIFAVGLFVVLRRGQALNITANPFPPSDEGGGFCEAKDGGRDNIFRKQIVFLSPSRDDATTAPSSEGAILFFRRGIFCCFAGRCGHRPLRIAYNYLFFNLKLFILHFSFFIFHKKTRRGCPPGRILFLFLFSLCFTESISGLAPPIGVATVGLTITD